MEERNMQDNDNRHRLCFISPPPPQPPRHPTPPPTHGQDGRNFEKRHFKTHFLVWNIRISIQMPLQIVFKGLIDNKSALIQVMAWRRTGDMLLHEAMVTRFSELNRQ